MKINKYYFVLLTLATLAVSGCKEADIDNEHHYDNKLYVSSEPICRDLLIKPEVSTASREIAYRIASPATQDIEINFDAAPYLSAAYNLSYGDKTFTLGAKYYDIPVKTTVIKAGDISSENVVVNFKNTSELDNSKRYVLPVTITSASNIGVLESSRTVYFVFKGAALINVVANIKKVQFPIYWKSSVGSLSTVTIEALVRSKDWTEERPDAVNSVFGIENHFLIRIGDSDRPRNQIQIVSPGGKFPDPNKAPGLPVNEWVHIAVVYNNVNKERIYYINGVAVHKDEGASGAINLNLGGCYIGRSYDSNRWLSGEISEVRVWSVQRTTEQIAANPYYVDPASEGLVAYWKFNEGTGNVITDHTGHGNNLIGESNTASSATPQWINVELPKMN